MRRHGIEDFTTKFSDEQWAETYPALLRKNGYWTGFIGKFGVGSQVVKTYSGRFDYFQGVEGQGGKYFIDPKDPSRTHETTRFGNDAIEFLESAPTDKPFCLSISFTAPHARDLMPHLEQFQPDDRDLDLYKETPFVEPVTATDEFFNKLPLFVQTSLSHVRWLWRFDTPQHYEISAKNYFRLITGIDREVGRILDQLTKKDLSRNTVIIFTSDNGFFLGDRKLSDKFYMMRRAYGFLSLFVIPGSRFPSEDDVNPR